MNQSWLGFAGLYLGSSDPLSVKNVCLFVCLCVCVFVCTMSNYGDDTECEMWTHTFTGAFTRNKDGHLVFVRDWTGAKNLFKLTEAQYQSARDGMQTVIDTLTDELKALLLQEVPTADPKWEFGHQIHHMNWTCAGIPEETRRELSSRFAALTSLEINLSGFNPSSSRYE